MADINERVEENVPGKYYVDRDCIDCDHCRDTAPDNFTRSDENSYSYVFKQPENETEEEACYDAMIGCPVDTIGEDGEDA